MQKWASRITEKKEELEESGKDEDSEED